MNSKPTSSDRAAEVAVRQAQRVMRDTRFDHLRTRGARRALFAATGAALVAIPNAWLWLGSTAGLVVVLVGVAALFLLRRSVRTIADLPDEHLDERQLELRNEAYLLAYRWFAGLLAAAASLAMLGFVLVAEDDVHTLRLTWEQLSATFWTMIGAALAFPSMALAVLDPGERRPNQAH